MVTAILKRKWKKANVAENNVFCNLALLQKIAWQHTVAEIQFLSIWSFWTIQILTLKIAQKTEKKFVPNWMNGQKWDLPQCATLKKFADALGALSALSLSDFFCFLTSSIFSLISSPFLFLLHDFTIYFCRNASSSIPVANYVMTSKLSFFSESWPRQSRRWKQCQHRYGGIGVLRMPKFHHQPWFRPSFELQFEFRFQPPACFRDHLSYHTWASADDNSASSATSTVQFRLFLSPKLPFFDLQFGVNG